MKKVLSLFISIVMLFSITAGLDLTASADISGDFEYTILDDGTAEITAYSGSATELSIPTTLDGYTVVSIGDYAFWYCISLSSITTPNGVTSIGDYAYYGCSSLTSVTIGNNVTKIGNDAFSGCSSLTSVRIGNSVTSIGDWAFYDCSSLTSVTIADSVISIGEGAFYHCSSLSSITIPNSVTSIGDGVFYDCSGLTSITVDSNNQYYSSQDGVLYDKNKTTLIQYPIGNLRTSYEILNSVISIGKCAFSFCGSLTSITIPDSVTSIGDRAFSHCSSLSSVTISNRVTNIGGSSFFYCSNLKDVYYSGTEEQWYSISIGEYNNCLTDATIHYNYHQHTYSDVVTQPSCTAGGYTTHTCTICGESYVDSYTNPTGHIFNGGKNCVVCGAVNPNYVEPTPTPTPAPTTTAPIQTTTTTKKTTTKASTVKKPKSTSISKLTKGKKQFKVTWKKVGSISGYQIQYSTDKKFKKNVKSVTVKKSSISTTIKKLKSGKTYYVRVRTYKTTKVNGKTTKVYSSWSKVKSVKTK